MPLNRRGHAYAPEVLLRMKCDVHPWMFAHIGVCEHPYFGVTDKDGNFTIPGVPKDCRYPFINQIAANVVNVPTNDAKPKIKLIAMVPAAPMSIAVLPPMEAST